MANNNTAKTSNTGKIQEVTIMNDPDSNHRTINLSRKKNRLSRVLCNEPERITMDQTCRKDDYANLNLIKLVKVATNYVDCSECNDKMLIKYITNNGAEYLINYQSNYYKSKSTLGSTSRQQTIDCFTTKKVSQKEKSEISVAKAICMATDFRPFTMVEGQGFKYMVLVIIKVESTKGSIDASEILCQADTVVIQLEKSNSNSLLA